jgi:tetrahydromethanopterin S-methyltransferase subunit B
MNVPMKTTQDQIQELHKLVDDALEALDQVARGLTSLERRLAGEASVGPSPKQ